MPDHGLTQEEYWRALNPEDPRVQVIMLAKRIDDLEKKTVAQAERIVKLERLSWMGAGIMWALPFITAGLAWFIAYAKTGGRP